MRKRLYAISVGLMAACSLSFAQVDLDKEFFSLPDTVTNAYLDSVTIRARKPNDYWMIGVYGGASAQFGFWNPSRLTTAQLQFPVYGFSVIRQFTMFGLYPFLGLEFGAQQNYEGYEFKTNKETKYRSTESGAYKAMMRVPEAFILTHGHFDLGEHFKFMLKVGLYGGYRTSITRVLDDNFVGSSYEQYVSTFRDYDLRWTYGVMGGVGMGLVFNPIEIHLNVNVKWGWGSFWQPDYTSPYYYRFGYPLDGTVTLGVYYQLTPRYGHTRAQLRRLARKMIEEQQQKP